MKTEGLAPECVAFDLEVGKNDHHIYQFGAVRSDGVELLHHVRGEDAGNLRHLDEFCSNAAFLLGHNIIHFDLPHLAATRPDLRMLQKPVVDTLWLNPLAFPRNPYHHLVKHYQDGRLHVGHRNDPLQDAKLVLALFRDQQAALAALNESHPHQVTAWHWLATRQAAPGFDNFFSGLRRQGSPTTAEAYAAIGQCLGNQACITQSRQLIEEAPRDGWPLAYALAWLSVAGGNSVMPPWVRHQFPAAGDMVRRLRDLACTDPACLWCREHHDAKKELKRWFGFDRFRPEPVDPQTGNPLQQRIVESAMAGKHVLGILPTGTGKSVCYQVPALSRFEKTGALTVVISPLVALMADQVAGLAARGIESCAALNGMLSMPERAAVLDRVRMGDAGILIVSPEQLRSKAFRNGIAQREIGAWVLDEAHCLSKWGHDFRPDYRYVGRFIKERAGNAAIPSVLCLTATAKPEVIGEIVAYFRDKVGVDLECLNGGAERKNLIFDVVQTTPAAKFEHVYQLISHELAPEAKDGAIVYGATRRQVEEVAGYLKARGLAAGHFHAGLPPETKKLVQESFIRGELRVIAATNAFGMGIDKPDVRLVVHSDIPGSLENYLQEAGRAGRDTEDARCVLLYTPEDVERQFGMSAASRLTRKEIQIVLRSLRSLHKKKHKGGEGVVATPGEILAEDENGVFERDTATDDTRVRTAISWLEEAALLQREENQIQVFPSSLRVGSVEEARKRLLARGVAHEYQQKLLNVVDALMQADADEGISTDALMGVANLSSEAIRKAFFDLEQLGIASNDTVLTAYIHIGIERSSEKRLERVAQLEQALIDELRSHAPDMHAGDESVMHLRIASQHLKDAGFNDAYPEVLRRVLKSLAADGRDEANGKGSLALKRVDGESLRVTLNRDWHALAKTAELRRSAAMTLLGHLVSRFPVGARGADLLAETTMGNLVAALEADLLLKSEIKNLQKCLDRALLWLHEQEVIRLNKGLAVFRPAMTIQLDEDWKKQFVQADFEPLRQHYGEQVIQIHVMAEYVQRGLHKMADAVKLAIDYFTLRQEDFLQRWLPGREKDLQRQTTPESWQKIVEALGNREQRDIVADDREGNALVLAGPGSGKTRVLVHRIAYLVRVKRENPHGIVALAYNRHAAVQIRQRLENLIGDDARRVMVLTLHALAMRLVGATLAGRNDWTDEDFRRVLREAAAMLRGDGLAPDEADTWRDRLLAGFRWILVDEYQDIGSDEYALISALAGRTRSDEDGKINLFAVGDDDQNIYGFKGASTEFIRRFESDYRAKTFYLVDNYRSTRHIISAANALIFAAPERMKADHPIRIDKARARTPPGGQWEGVDPVGQGRVQVLSAGDTDATQAMAVMAEFERLAALDSDWDWSACAVIARDWKWLEPVRSYCELKGIPAQFSREENRHFWRLRETQYLLAQLTQSGLGWVSADQIEGLLAETGQTPAWGVLHEAVRDYALETGNTEQPMAGFVEWLAEWGREIRRRPNGLLLVTAHGAKGLEFDHVIVLDGSWQPRQGEDVDSVRRLYYVAMTRARHTLGLARIRGGHMLRDVADKPWLLTREIAQKAAPPSELARRYLRPELSQIDLGFVGGFPPQTPIHARIARLDTNIRLHLEQEGGSWYLLDTQGEKVGRMARAFSPPQDMRCIEARVSVIVVRRKSDTGPEYKEPKCEQWEVVVPELVFAPITSAGENGPA